MTTATIRPPDETRPCHPRGDGRALRVADLPALVARLPVGERLGIVRYESWPTAFGPLPMTGPLGALPLVVAVAGDEVRVLRDAAGLIAQRA